MPVLSGGSPCILRDRGEDVTETGMDSLARPWQPHRVLAHFQTGRCHTASVCCLTRAEEDFLAEKKINACRHRRHIGRFGDQVAAILDQFPRVFAGDFVLSGAWECTIAFDAPRALPFYIFGALELLDVFFDASAPHVLDALDPSQFFCRDTILVVNKAAGIGHSKNLRATFD